MRLFKITQEHKPWQGDYLSVGEHDPISGTCIRELWSRELQHKELDDHGHALPAAMQEALIVCGALNRAYGCEQTPAEMVMPLDRPAIRGRRQPAVPVLIDDMPDYEAEIDQTVGMYE